MAFFQKLLKYPWKPATEERIARHDASAMRNWRELKEGTLDIPEQLREHFLKFSERTIPPLNKKSIKLDVSEEKIGEFEQIVRRCASNEEKQSTDFDSSDSSTSSSTEDSQPIKKDWKRVTLDELASTIKTRLDGGKHVDIPDQMIMDTVNTVPIKTDSIQTNRIDSQLISEKNEKDLTNYKEENKEIGSVSNYPERIRIPKKAYQRGATYKVNDCFYDHDGRFLYRVIGMTDTQ